MASTEKPGAPTQPELLSALSRCLDDWNRALETLGDRAAPRVAALRARSLELEQQARSAEFDSLAHQLKHLVVLLDSGAKAPTLRIWMRPVEQAIAKARAQIEERQAPAAAPNDPTPADVPTQGTRPLQPAGIERSVEPPAATRHAATAQPGIAPPRLVTRPQPIQATEAALPEPEYTAAASAALAPPDSDADLLPLPTVDLAPAPMPEQQARQRSRTILGVGATTGAPGVAESKVSPKAVIPIAAVQLQAVAPGVAEPGLPAPACPVAMPAPSPDRMPSIEGGSEPPTVTCGALPVAISKDNVTVDQSFDPYPAPAGVRGQPCLTERPRDPSIHRAPADGGPVQAWRVTQKTARFLVAAVGLLAILCLFLILVVAFE